MDFEKRDLLLISGIILFMIGLLGVGLNIVESIGISIAIYFGIKVFVGRKKKLLAKEMGEGYCVECGEKIIEKRCPNCNEPSK